MLSVFFVVVCVAVLVSVGRCDSTPRPVVTSNEGGFVDVSVPGLQGAVSLTVVLHDDTTRHSAVITHQSADGKWRTRFAGVTSQTKEVNYVITYRFLDTDHTFSGTEKIQGKDVTEQSEVALNSGRYLRRRATTVFYDDFSSGHLDLTKWRHTIDADWYSHNQVQMYTPEPVNTYIKHGILYIRPTLTVDTFGADFLTHGHLNVKEQWGSCDSGSCVADGANSIHPIMSGMLHSSGTIRFGKVEIVAKMAVGDWFWNALWLMPVKNTYGTWPASGEIDIIECAGNRHLTNRANGSSGIDRMGSSIHYGIDRHNHIHEHGDYNLPHGNLADTFRTYWLDWTEQHITIGVDDHTVFKGMTPQHGYFRGSHQNGTNPWTSGGHSAPFDSQFHLIMNVHVGGNPFDNPHWHNHPYARPWDPQAADQVTQFWKARHLWQPTWQGETAAMQVKSVKMQQY